MYVKCCYFHVIVGDYSFKTDMRENNKNGVHGKTGELTIILNGMEVDIEQFPVKVPNGVPNGRSLAPDWVS